MDCFYRSRSLFEFVHTHGTSLTRQGRTAVKCALKGAQWKSAELVLLPFFVVWSNKQGVDCCPAVLLKSVSISVTASLGVYVFWHSTRFRGSSAYLSISIYLSIYLWWQGTCMPPDSDHVPIYESYIWRVLTKVVYLKGLRTQQFAKWALYCISIVDI